MAIGETSADHAVFPFVFLRSIKMKSLLSLCFVIGASLIISNRSFGITSVILPKEANQIAEMRIAGLNKDFSQIPTLITTLEQSHDDPHIFTALHALAQMGAIEALPEIRILKNSNDPATVAFSTVEEARLIAEHSAAMNPNGLPTEDAIMSKFYKTLSVSPGTINPSVARSYTGEMPLFRKGESGYAIPMEVYVMRETADILYRDFPHNAGALANIPPLNFPLDYPSALKLRLGPLTTEQRINIMVEELARKEKLTANDDYEIQLLADEGVPASNAVAAKLRVMDADRQHFKGMGFAALFQVLEAIGIQSQAAIVDHFRDDKDGDVEYYANQVYYNVKLGLKQGRATDY
ncbi:MAG: hypothetical protein ACRYFS_21525 [Janthinobacterium lividum]